MRWLDGPLTTVCGGVTAWGAGSVLGGYISDKVEDGDGLREEVAYYLQVRDVLVHPR